MPEYHWRGACADAELVELTESHGGKAEPGWWNRVREHSLGWVTARESGVLIGFVNIAWDGADHAFLLDTKVHGQRQHRGIGTELVAKAVLGARAAGCEWLHVDWSAGLAEFYRGACGFTPTEAGLIQLPTQSPTQPDEQAQ